jgi:hypothetical protein
VLDVGSCVVVRCLNFSSFARGRGAWGLDSFHLNDESSHRLLD